MNPSLIFLTQCLVIVALPVALLRVSGLKGVVPLAVVQITLGIILGPSVFGRIMPDTYQILVNPMSLMALSGIGSIAVLIFGLITGLHFETQTFDSQARAFSTVALARIVIPTALGVLAGFWILARHPEELMPGVDATAFAAAVGICVGMTALPVLGAILREMNLLDSRIGQFAIGIAGTTDAVLWILLSIVLTAQAGGGGNLALLALPVYLLVMIKAVRPALARMVTARMHDGVVDERALTVVGGLAIASAFATEAMGLHYVVGAFMAGAIVPRHLCKPLLDRLQALTGVLLMPFFFALTGMRTAIDPSAPAFLEVFSIATLVAGVGIMGGTAVVARCVGETWPFALALGALSQAKGLMEVIVLTVLLDARIISNNIFAALVLMAIVSTALTMPLARLMLALDSRRLRQMPPAPVLGQRPLA